MKTIEQKISPLIARQFPSFYQEEGPNFIAFVKAYYEWLEQNFQLIELEDITNFNTGDTVRQSDVTGTVFAIDSKSILVLVDGLDTFKCFNVCSELIPVISSSGGNSLIRRGGTTQRLGSIFLSRNLLNIADIDKTIDLFIVKFKEKYLRNVEFETETNKRLLVKNSLDLYRSKGTERSIDLFFRLIYGVRSEVYYPGDDLFKLSAGEWFRPQYIEINPNSVDRAISLVGRQIVGVNSGATAFVERYAKRKVSGNFVHLLFVSSVQGTFEVAETLKGDQIFPDSPTVLGSLVDIEVIDGGADFTVGETINISSLRGTSAVGRVASTARGTGEVRFALEDGGWGFSVNVDSGQPLQSKTLLSDKIITVTGVEPSAWIAEIDVVNGGSGYSNTDVIHINGQLENAIGIPTTNGSGAIQSVRVVNRGVGFYPNRLTSSIDIKDDQGDFSSGAGATFSLKYRYPKSYLRYLEQFTQKLQKVTYNDEVGLADFTPGTLVNIDNIGTGVVLSTDFEQSEIVFSCFDNIIINPGDSIFLANDSTRFVLVGDVEVAETSAKVIGVSDRATLEVSTLQGVIQPDSIIIQRNNNCGGFASARVVSTAGLLTTSGSITVDQITGVFRPGEPIEIAQDDGTAILENVILDFAVAETVGNSFVSDMATITTSNNGFNGQVVRTTGGEGAQFGIADVSEVEFVRVNTDFLNNQTLLNTRLSDTYSFFTANNQVDSSSVIYGGLAFVEIPVGSIEQLGGLNPGRNYGTDPVVSIFQPGIKPLYNRDIILRYEGNLSQFFVDETITQINTFEVTRFGIDSNTGFRVGEQVSVFDQTSTAVAEGIITNLDGLNVIDLRIVDGNVPIAGTLTIESRISQSIATVISREAQTRTTTARGIIKQIDGDIMIVRRIQLENNFRTGVSIVGSRSGTLAVITEIQIDADSKQIGFNASVNAKASIAQGVINTVEILDSGLGFSNDRQATFVTPDGSKSGTFGIVRGGVGTSAGSYRDNKGFVSDLSKVHDGDYYQEYSYDIITRLPLDKYATMFKKVMHTAGTRFFGSVLIETIAEIQATPAPTPIALQQGESTPSIIVGDSPFAVVDRTVIDVEDRRDIVIEIRE